MRVPAVLVAATLLLPACSGSNANVPGEKARRKPAVPVTVALVSQKPVPLQIQAIGNVEAYSTVSVKAQVGGELVRVHFREGHDVRKGELLFTIDPRPFEATLAQAQANLEKDRAQVKQARAMLERDLARVNQARATLAKDQAQAQNAEVQARRYAELLKKELIAQEQYDQVRTNAESLAAAVRADQAAIESAEEAVRADQAAIESAEQTVRADQAAVENTKLQLAYTTIHSPIDGRTGSLMLHEGNIVRSSGTNDSTLVAINQVQPIYVSFALPERELPVVKRYMAAGKLEVEAFPAGEEQPPARGVITFVDNAVDRATGTIRLKATFANEEKRLWPGQFANVALTLATEPDAIVVPSQAIQTGQEGQYVFVVKPDSTVEVRPVVVERIHRSETVVAKGLKPGETVVTDGQLRLVPGATVEVKGRS
jgi:multidrug efflux system membrane fusion protein